jgi:signal transduction histidine kinase
MLTGISFLMKTLSNKINKIDNINLREVDEISRLLKEATKQCRHLSKGLLIEGLGDDGILIALDQLATTTRELFNVNCEIKTNGIIDLKNNFISTQIYRIAQESVNNAIKHSGANNIYINIENKNNNMILMIHDDGSGITEHSKHELSGMGMGIMKYRANLIDASFESGNSEM